MAFADSSIIFTKAEEILYWTTQLLRGLDICLGRGQDPGGPLDGTVPRLVLDSLADNLRAAIGGTVTPTPAPTPVPVPTPVPAPTPDPAPDPVLNLPKYVTTTQWPSMKIYNANLNSPLAGYTGIQVNKSDDGLSIVSIIMLDRAGKD